MARVESKAKQILDYLSEHRGETVDSLDVAAKLGTTPNWVTKVAQMNPGACRTVDFGDLIEIFPEDVDMRSTTSDIRDVRRLSNDTTHGTRGTRSWKGRRTLRRNDGDTVS
mgnify:CR=1 FL=1